MNAKWHSENRLGTKASLQERISWHRKHQKHCTCRPIPKSLLPYFDGVKKSRLKRELHPMPPFVKQALISNNLMTAYRRRPPYQQNDYVGWITRAKQKATQEKRLNQMIDELIRGDRYMKMVYAAKGE